MILFGIFITIPRRNPRIMENTMEISAILIVTHKPCQSLNELIPLKKNLNPHILHSGLSFLQMNR
mgnify:CR=1 FL=1